jgi:hypothetical protein
MYMGDAYFRSAASENGMKHGSVALTHTAPDQTRPMRTQRPIIFLDIDGVLNRSSGYARSNDHVVEMDLLARLKSLVASTNVRVVLASTWRHEADGVQKAREVGIPFEDILPDLRPHSRGTEVKAWLANHPNVERFAIIDDDDDGYENMPLFQPNPYKGLSHEVAAAVEEYFAATRNDDYRRSSLTRACQYLMTFFEGHRG